MVSEGGSGGGGGGGGGVSRTGLMHFLLNTGKSIHTESKPSLNHYVYLAESHKETSWDRCNIKLGLREIRIPES